MTVFGLCRDEREGEREKKKQRLAIPELQKQPIVSNNHTRTRSQVWGCKCGLVEELLWKVTHDCARANRTGRRQKQKDSSGC